MTELSSASGFEETPDAKLLRAARNDDVELAHQAIQENAEIDRVEDGDTPLHRAINNNSYAVAEWLVIHGANVNVSDPLWWTPLHLAAMNGRAGLAKELMKRGADRHAKDKKGETPRGLVPPGIDIPWDDLCDKAVQALNTRTGSELASLLLHNGKPTQALLELCGTRRLGELFTLGRWDGDEGGAIKLAAEVELCLPPYWRQKMLIDLAPFRRKANVGFQQTALAQFLRKGGIRGPS